MDPGTPVTLPQSGSSLSPIDAVPLGRSTSTSSAPIPDTEAIIGPSLRIDAILPTSASSATTDTQSPAQETSDAENMTTPGSSLQSAGAAPVLFDSATSTSAKTQSLSQHTSKDVVMVQPSSLPSAEAEAALGQPDCLFLDKLPIEIRNQIYGYLLVNPILGKPEGIEGIYTSGSKAGCSSYGCKVEYGLHPAILRTSRQIYSEASRVLYGYNTFFISCVENFEFNDLSTWTSNFQICPLTRYLNNGNDYNITSLKDTPGIMKVDNWKVIIGALAFGHEDIHPKRSLDEFCRARCHAPPKALEILVIPKGMDPHWSIGFDAIYEPIARVLHPLNLFRGIQRFNCRDASIDDLPYHIVLNEDAVPVFESHLTPRFSSTVETLVVGNTLNEPLFEMHGCLLRYAQAFERIPHYKIQMSLPKDGRTAEHLHLYTCQHQYQRDPPEIYPEPWNPYREASLPHPVEEYLGLATLNSEFQEANLFKQNRSHVLAVLEPQYQRIVQASLNLVEFIKWEKMDGGLLDPQRSSTMNITTNKGHIVNAIEILEDLAAAYVREVTPSVRSEIRRNQRRFDGNYEVMKREIYLRNLGTALDLKNFEHFEEWFKIVVNDMDSQFLEIRAARKALFKWDVLNERGTDIDIEESICDDPIDWSKTQPFIGPLRKL